VRRSPTKEDAESRENEARLAPHSVRLAITTEVTVADFPMSDPRANQNCDNDRLKVESSAVLSGGVAKVTVVLWPQQGERGIMQSLEMLSRQTILRTHWALYLSGAPELRKLAVDSGRSLGLEVKGLSRLSENFADICMSLTSEDEREVFVFLGCTAVLQPDYLECVRSIVERFPELGVWGGQVLTGIESELPPWIGAAPWLAGSQPVQIDRWANSRRGYEFGGAFPFCGPLCLRASALAEWRRLPHYERLAKSPEDPQHGADWPARFQLAFGLHHLGWGTGLFHNLKAIIPGSTEGTSLNSIIGHVEEIEYARFSLLKWWGWMDQIPKATKHGQVLEDIRRSVNCNRDQRRLLAAQDRGRIRAANEAIAGAKVSLQPRRREERINRRPGHLHGQASESMNSGGMPAEVSLSVVICTHNPRKDVLAKALQALSTQTLAADRWELLIIDNDSAEPVEGWVRAPWCKGMKVIREPERGINFARTRGLREARGELILFVDDDNVLEANYLATALRIGREHPQLGIWGGIIELEFEVKPPSWIDLYRATLAERLVERDVWSNLIFDGDSTPITAGCCLRRELAQAFVQRMENLPIEFRLGRRGSQLTNCEDIDLAWTACQHGWGMGLFRSLRLKHLIPPLRLEEDYLLRLTEGTAYSYVLLYALWGERSRLTLLDRCVRWWRIQKMRQMPLRGRMKSELRGQQRAHRWLKTPRIRQLLAAASCRSASSSNSSLDAAILSGRV